jgi:hypothetical protein
VGQDGHDLAGPATALGPSGVQDIHIALAGLPPAKEIVFISVRPLGGGEWLYKGPHGPWGAALVRQPGSMTADLYVEPSQVERGRRIEIVVRFDDDSTLTLITKGGRADPNLRMPSAALHATWEGQVAEDHVGMGPAVGPDGIQDVRIALARLSPQVAIQSVAVEATGLTGWEYGTNPRARHNAELFRRANDPTAADLFVGAQSALAGKMAMIVVTYANGKIDRARVKAGAFDPELKMPRPTPVSIIPNKIQARWLGQDGNNRVGPGDVHVVVDGVRQDSTIFAVGLSNSARGSWYYRADGAASEPPADALPLALGRGAKPDTAELFFPPNRDETGGTMFLRLVFADGKMTLATFPGGKCEPGLRAAAVRASSSVTARPGDDLNELANRFGTVTLPPGTYRLERPLVLNKPVRLTGEPGATLVFRQPAGSPSWSAAIKIHAGHTILESFSIRFDAPVRWSPGINYGPAVIGTTDNLDPAHPDLRADITLARLDIEGPPPSGAGPWEDAIGLARLVGAPCGRIEDNVLKGGPIEFFDGPWLIAGNEHRGTPPGTASPAVFAGHGTHDIVVRKNRTHLVAPAGKTWRFLVLTGTGAGDRIEENHVEGIGPRDDDSIPSANAPEIILTESYRLHFEGKPLAISADGRIVQIPAPQGDAARSGDALAILAGSEAGHWRRVVQAIDARTYWVDPPLPHGTDAISLASGFVGETLAGNTIDTRGGSVAVNLVLGGNHFGTQVVNNHFLGGGDAFRLTAVPTEQPVMWGWSRAPFLDVLIAKNTIEDSLRGGTIAVEHGPPMKSIRGRVYLLATVKGNVGVWTDDWLRRRMTVSELVALRLGMTGASEPGEALLTEADNEARTAGGRAVQVYSATVNGRAVKPRPAERGHSERRAQSARREP